PQLRAVRVVQLDLEHRVQRPRPRVRVHARARLRIAVDRDGPGDTGKWGKRLDRMNAGARDIKGDDSWSRDERVRIQNCLPQAPQSGVVRIRYGEGVGHRAKANREKDSESDSEPRWSAHISPDRPARDYFRREGSVKRRDVAGCAHWKYPLRSRMKSTV